MLLNNFLEDELKIEWRKGENAVKVLGKKQTQVRGAYINSG